MPDHGSLYEVEKLKPFHHNIVLDIILFLFTCGIYGLFWQHAQMKCLNYILQEEKYHFAKWFFFSLFTCGIYHIYHEFVMAKDINVLQERFEILKSEGLPVLSVFISIFQLGIVADAIQQNEINAIIEYLKPELEKKPV